MWNNEKDIVFVQKESRKLRGNKLYQDKRKSNPTYLNNRDKFSLLEVDSDEPANSNTNRTHKK